MSSKYNYINDNIKIDFSTSKLMENTMKEAEEYDLQKSMEYFCVADAIDVIAKQLYASGRITQKQWDLIVLRYPGM